MGVDYSEFCQENMHLVEDCQELFALVERFENNLFVVEFIGGGNKDQNQG